MQTKSLILFSISLLFITSCTEIEPALVPVDQRFEILTGFPEGDLLEYFEEEDIKWWEYDKSIQKYNCDIGYDSFRNDYQDIKLYRAFLPNGIVVEAEAGATYFNDIGDWYFTDEGRNSINIVLDPYRCPSCTTLKYTFDELNEKALSYHSEQSFLNCSSVSVRDWFIIAVF
ncbi:hypothetical protein [Flammeovirga sp. SJP92]|uniref:hypothetical protein n=1 Tax=Flammeovirga sp. SJP92 TaxID=1775430 RepID=UPI0007885AAB|nr:hypothetical protein [Flammeovirga sp. SJP92]KXX69637.1 hypothetical protein AVL50_15360 [Flammeovirga sp. SJP92]